MSYVCLCVLLNTVMRGVTFGVDVAVLRWQEAVLERQKRYKELHRREERFKQLKIIADKLQTKQHLSAVSSPVGVVVIVAAAAW